MLTYAEPNLSKHFILLCFDIEFFLGYLTVAIVRPAEPAHDGRAHPGERPGQGPEKWPIGERLCHREVGEARWEDPTVPGKLDGDIHDEIPKTM